MSVSSSIETCARCGVALPTDPDSCPNNRVGEGGHVTADPDILCDVVDGCTNGSIDCVGGEVYYCAEHEDVAGEAYLAWRNSREHRTERGA